MIHLALTLDYEMFGNGAGDVMRDVIEPTNRLLVIYFKYSAKMLILFEVGRHWFSQEYELQVHTDF